MTIKSSRLFISICAVATLFLAGCATRPKIDTAKLGAPKTVVVETFPKINNVAQIGVVVPWAPGFPGFHFSEKADPFFVVENDQTARGEVNHVGDYTAAVNNMAMNHILLSPKPMSIGTAGAIGGVGGLIGALIQSSAEETQRKALGFNSALLKLDPTFDLRADFMTSLHKALASKGMVVRVSNESQNVVPRLRWPAVDEEGNKYLVRAYESPLIDADILMQVSPIAFYNAPGPLNAYRRNVSVGLALFNGRTKSFIGMQTLRFDAPDSRFEYARYDDLVASLDEAAPALRDALLSLVPEVADLVSGKKVQE